MSSPRKLTPQEEAKLAQARKSFQERKQLTNSLKNISKRIGVYSGKGGVGKTTITTNLAVTLAEQNHSVAIFDCDIDCPNVTRLLRISEGPIQDGDKLIPPSRFGVKVMSMSFFQNNEDEAIIWRGPMIHNAINQFTQSTEWGNLDFMLIDLPPGTSDAPLTVMQTLNLDGFIIVTTPQELAVLDAKRSINMIKKMNLTVYGIVENLSGGIFGTGGGKSLAEEMGLPFLGNVNIREEYTNANKPVSLENKEIQQEYIKIIANLKI